MQSLNTNVEELFTKTFFGYFTLPTLYVILGIIIVLSLYILFKLEKIRLKQNVMARNIDILKQKSDLDEDEMHELTTYTAPKNTKLNTLFRGIMYMLIISSSFILYLTITTHITANKHGFTEPKSTHLNTICYSIEHSPSEDKLPSDKTDIIVIYYRFGCSDCELLYNKIKDRTNNVNHIYWVATRSKQGTELRNTYPIAEVPTSIYIDTSGEMTEYSLSIKSTTNNQTNISLNEKNLNDLLSNLHK